MDSAIWFAGKVVYGSFHVFGWPLIRAIGRMKGNRAYASDTATRETIRGELARTFGKATSELEIDEMTRQALRLYHTRQVEMFFFGAMSKRRINQGMRVEGLEHIDAALAKGKGVIILLSHLGSFLLPLPFLGHAGYKTNQIAGREVCGTLLAQRIWEWRRKQAARLPVNFVQIGTFLRPVYKALKVNELVAIAFDGRDSEKWVIVDFFERKARFSPGPFELARRTGATIIPTFTIRGEDGVHKLILDPPFQLSEDQDVEKAAEADTRRFAEIWIGYVRKHPCHFGMIVHKLKEQELAGEKSPFFADS